MMRCSVWQIQSLKMFLRQVKLNEVTLIHLQLVWTRFQRMPTSG